MIGPTYAGPCSCCMYFVWDCSVWSFWCPYKINEISASNTGWCIFHSMTAFFVSFFLFIPLGYPLTWYFIKFKAGDGSSDTPTNSEMVSKEKPSKKNRKKDRDSEGSSPVDHRTEEKLLVLPCGPSAVGIMLLIILSGFYVVRELFFLQTTFPLDYMNIASKWCHFCRSIVCGLLQKHIQHLQLC